MKDQGYTLPQQAVRAIARILNFLDDLNSHFTGMDDFAKMLHFAASSSRTLLRDDNRDLWKRANLKKDYDIDAATHDTAVLIWMALSLGRIINQYREVSGKKPINWEKKALEIDRDEKKAIEKGGVDG